MPTNEVEFEQVRPHLERAIREHYGLPPASAAAPPGAQQVPVGQIVNIGLGVLNELPALWAIFQRVQKAVSGG